MAADMASNVSIASQETVNTDVSAQILSKVRYLTGNAPKSGENALFANIHPLAPYDDTVCAFFQTLSTKLMPHARAYPDIGAFAFWCRKGHIDTIKAQFEARKAKNALQVGRGVVFHIAPANVPVNFAFSFAFGLLAGNANIVRVPSKPFPQTDIICDAIVKCFNDERFSNLAKSNAFIQYDRDDAITAYYSARCDARVIWGGDATVNHIRAMPMPPRAVEIAFADRYSFCVLSPSAVNALDDVRLARLAESFYNDSYLMDQNACSSPQVVVWWEESCNCSSESQTTLKSAMEKFWNALDAVAQKYELPPVAAVDKYTQWCEDAMTFALQHQPKRKDNVVYRVLLDTLTIKPATECACRETNTAKTGNLNMFRGKYGYFYEYATSRLSDLAPWISKGCQTVTYFGVNSNALAQFAVDNGLQGIDRVVPVGKALDIGTIWDGYDVIGTLSRIIDIR